MASRRRTEFEWDPEKDLSNKVGEGILTVRFTYREHLIRIFGAGYWRKGRRIYNEQNQL